MTSAVSHRPPLRFHALTGWYDRAAEWTASASRIQQRLAQWAVLARPARVLDLGCGTGNLTRALALALPGATIYGLDPDRRALQIATTKLASTTPHVHLVEGSAQALPSALSELDLVTSCLVFHHLDPEVKSSALREIHRVLRPGGCALIADFDRPTTVAKQLLFTAVRWLDGARNTADHAAGSFQRILASSPLVDLVRLETHEVPIGTIGIWQLHRPGRMAANGHPTRYLLGGERP